MSVRAVVRVEFEYDEVLALAVGNWYGDDRPATHEEMRRWFFAYGESASDDIIHELQHGKAEIRADTPDEEFAA